MTPLIGTRCNPLSDMFHQYLSFCFPCRLAMHQNFHSYQKADSSHEKDKMIIVSVFLHTEGSEISIEFNRTTKTKGAGGKLNTTLKESVYLHNISAKDLGIISSLISNWIGSRSLPVISDSLDDISGKYEKSPKQTGYRSRPKRIQFEFESIDILLGTAGLAFMIPRGEDQIEFNIPASEVPGEAPEYTNISRLRDVIYDFFELEFEGSMEGLEIELPPEIESSERLDEVLQRRAVTEFESQHFQSSVRTAFTVLEERVRELGEYPDTEYGTGLIQKAFHPEDGRLAFGESTGERDGVMFLYRGAFQALRNPVSHRFIESVDEDYARDAIHTVNLLLRLLHENHAFHPDRSA